MGSGTTVRKMYTMYKGLMKESEDMIGVDGCDMTLSQYWGYPLQAHHCISCSVMNTVKNGLLSKKAISAGYDINNANNGIALPAYFGHQRLNNEQRHRGGHQKSYYQFVKEKLEPLYDKYKGKNVCPGKPANKSILKDLKGIENNIKGKLEGRKLWLYEWSEQLYNGDYRDEGAATLKSPRKREGSSTAGLDWLEKFGSAKIKRRYRDDAQGKATVRIEWYTKYAYPVPKNLSK